LKILSVHDPFVLQGLEIFSEGTEPKSGAQYITYGLVHVIS